MLRFSCGGEGCKLAKGFGEFQGNGHKNVLVIVIHTNLSLGKPNSTLPKPNMTIENYNS